MKKLFFGLELGIVMILLIYGYKNYKVISKFNRAEFKSSDYMKASNKKENGN